jgi:hypothetical protein
MPQFSVIKREESKKEILFEPMTFNSEGVTTETLVCVF